MIPLGLLPRHHADRDPGRPAVTFGDEVVSRSELCERLIARYKISRSIEFVSSAVRDDAGKVRRSALRTERVPTINTEQGKSR